MDIVSPLKRVTPIPSVVCLLFTNVTFLGPIFFNIKSFSYVVLKSRVYDKVLDNGHC